MASFAMQRCAPRRAGPMCAMEKPPPPVKTSSPPTRRPTPPPPPPTQLVTQRRNRALAALALAVLALGQAGLITP